MSRDEKCNAALVANEICDMTDLRMTDKNAQFDHIDPASTTDKTRCAVISAIANRRKSDQTYETICKTKDYMDKFR